MNNETKKIWDIMLEESKEFNSFNDVPENVIRVDFTPCESDDISFDRKTRIFILKDVA